MSRVTDRQQLNRSATRRSQSFPTDDDGSVIRKVKPALRSDAFVFQPHLHTTICPCRDQINLIPSLVVIYDLVLSAIWRDDAHIYEGARKHILHALDLALVHLGISFRVPIGFAWAFRHEFGSSMAPMVATVSSRVNRISLPLRIHYSAMHQTIQIMQMRPGRGLSAYYGGD